MLLVPQMPEVRFWQKHNGADICIFRHADYTPIAIVKTFLARDRSRAEAAELIILVKDMTEEFARALVAATPARGLRDASRKHIYGADPRRLKSMVVEREHLLRIAKPAFASFGRNALDLVAVEAFARRLMAIRSVVT